MYTLYWEATSGAIAPQALLEELGEPYRKVHVRMANGDHRSRAYAALCPTKRVPALGLPDGNVVGETAAIMVLLGERHPEGGMIPKPGDPDRGRFLYWLTAMATGGYPVFSRACHPEQFTKDDAANETVRDAAEEQLDGFFDILENAVGGDPFFLPRGYSALDLYVAMLSEWVASRKRLFAGRPKLAALCRAVDARPAYARTLADHGMRQPAATAAP